MNQTLSNTPRVNEDKIIEAALVCFGRYGFQKASMADVAKQAQLSRTALYKYYNNKEKLFLAICDKAFSEVSEAIQLAAQIEGEPLTRLQAIFSARMLWFFKMLDYGPHGFEMIDQNHKVSGVVGSKANQKFVARIAGLFEEAEASGELALAAQKVSPMFAAQLLVDSADGVLAETHHKDELQQRVALLIRVFWQGLAVR
ncbi:TetR/AcrR family transcriptional regulator [Paraferrimonas sedimenticola]|uniref:HTH tetR-type domain-containing protein n=1 Tax=Paraferrimonas sedimenticola TaxID=375674 RepID=A0AA37RUM6_9GAMM|nr:TetR/AcrR family transcriptional regulator [Paraferrimonas sedimenticola]GLP95508.1 hypothetical protein GCM10007895_08140 [Paraferrimonas sedimenticola]